jgi:phosphohistidine phosphatase
VDLYLVRHAIAEDRDPVAWPDDALRPLTEVGRARFRRAVAGLGRIVPSVEAMLASPFVRAWDTAAILAEQAGWPDPERCDPLRADRPARGVATVIRARRSLASLALVGHEPQLSELAARLLGGADDAFLIELKKGGVACLGTDDGRTWVLRWLATPRILRDLAR